MMSNECGRLMLMDEDVDGCDGQADQNKTDDDSSDFIAPCLMVVSHHYRSNSRL